MKTLSLIVLFSFFSSLTGLAQPRYAVEIIGGMKYNGFGPVAGSLNGITGGLGASMYLSRSAELIGTTLFTYFPPSNGTKRDLPPMPFYGAPAYTADNGQYSSEISAGLRLHGRGSQFIHPYLVVQGGMLLLRSTIIQGPWAVPAVQTPQFLNIQGTEDIQMLGVINLGIGLQACITESILLNLEAKFQMLIGTNSAETFIPVVVSVQLPA